MDIDSEWVGVDVAGLRRLKVGAAGRICSAYLDCHRSLFSILMQLSAGNPLLAYIRTMAAVHHCTFVVTWD